ncbi:MAG: phytanoyl-CoA dioxygenase family protein [Armatimonadetes bacterium]|nr:phytanoyl-CoA dioxygenase family protein [Armatimonadota bacterium]
MAFTPAQIQQFRTQGYLTIADFWMKEEVAAMQAELDRLRRDGRLRNVATDGDGKTHSQTQSNLQLCPMSPHSALFRALPFAPKVIEAVRQIIGDPVVLHLDQVFLKPARHGAGTNWHQDNAYFGISDPLKGTAMWTAVHDATVANGTIRVIPGSYKEKLEHSRDPQSDHHIRCYPDESRAVPLELPAGGVAFFAYGVAHATGGNGTDKDRAGAAYHFLNGDVIGADYFQQHNPGMAHPVLSGPYASDGTREYGQPIAGAWEREVEQAAG